MRAGFTLLVGLFVAAASVPSHFFFAKLQRYPSVSSALNVSCSVTDDKVSAECCCVERGTYQPYMVAVSNSTLAYVPSMFNNNSVIQGRLPPLRSDRYTLFVYLVKGMQARIAATVDVELSKADEIVLAGQCGHTGRWIRCQERNRTVACQRNGWMWQPWSCPPPPSIDVRALPYNHQPLWIAVAGTSTTRGIFFELADLLTGFKQLKLVDWWKCWGVLDFAVGNFRVTYVDLRLHYADSKLSPHYRQIAHERSKSLLCPSLLSAIPDWANFSLSPFRSSPDLVVAESPFHLQEQLQDCVRQYKADGGFFYGVSHKQRPPWSSKDMYQQLNERVIEQFGVLAIDVWHMSLPLFLTSRAGAANLHYVEQCGVADRYGRQVCSDVLETEVQILLAKAMQHRLIVNSSLSPNDTASRRQRFCSYCPVSFGHTNRTQPKCANHLTVTH